MSRGKVTVMIRVRLLLKNPAGPEEKLAVNIIRTSPSGQLWGLYKDEWWKGHWRWEFLSCDSHAVTSMAVAAVEAVRLRHFQFYSDNMTIICGTHAGSCSHRLILLLKFLVQWRLSFCVCAPLVLLEHSASLNEWTLTIFAGLCQSTDLRSAILMGV